ncbi:MAG: PASTA domain-containing protein [Clostridia bacterium]|nr:PASTA domain-containing protein [Clostridia bacterium]
MFISPADIDGNAERRLIAENLSRILDVDYDMVYEKGGLVKRKDETIKRGVEKEEADMVRAFIAEYKLDCVHLVTGTERYYPYGNLLSHVLGFTGTDGQGLYGVEYQYDEYLTGTSGKIVTAKNGLGLDMPYKYESYVKAVDGCDLVLTIDYNVQCILEKYLEEALEASDAQNRVTGIIMDPDTGEILAMATKPDFNCNEPNTLDAASQLKLDKSGYEVGSEDYNIYKRQLLGMMWANKAINDLYEPGSTFKIATCSMALEEDIVSRGTHYYCPGYHIVDGYGRIKCHKVSGHGDLNFEEGLQKSCNPTMMITAAKLGEERFYNYYESFGYKELTGIDLPGEASTYCHSFKNFHQTELAVYSFGQTFKLTAIRQLTSISSVANGGNIIVPHVVKQILGDDGNIVSEFGTTVKRQVISADTGAQICDILEKGVTNGVGATNAYVAGYKVGAKTGTSEKRDKADENGNFSLRIGSCFSVAPADDPEVTLIVVVDEPNAAVSRTEGSIIAAPYNSKILAEVLPYLGIEPEYSDKDAENKQTVVSSYIGADVNTAKNKLESLGYEVTVKGDGKTVVSQMPKAGDTLVIKSGKMILYTSSTEQEKTVKVPDVIGKSPSEANKLVIDSGLNISVSGAVATKTSYAVKQFPEAGSKVPEGTVVTIEFMFMDEIIGNTN